MIVMHATEEADSVLPLTPDERRATWAAAYYRNGFHRNPPATEPEVTDEPH